MNSGRKQFKIYGPAHFRATWQKYKEICARDGTTMSEQIRIFVEGQVARRDPGNPQRPLTAYVEGHPDEEKLQEQKIFKWILEWAEEHIGEIHYKNVTLILRNAGIPSKRVAALARDFAGRLKKDGVVVIY